MKIHIKTDSVLCYKDKGDKIYNESALFYNLKKIMNQNGFNLIKKEPAKDGHLTSMPYYLTNKKRTFMVIDNYYALRDPAKIYNERGIVELEFRRFLI